MARPRLIILIRHAQSEGNKNREIHQTIPDHRVKLTADGWEQAHEAGRRLRGILRDDDTLHFFISPYRRTRETTEGILATLTSDEPQPSPWKREGIKVYEEPRLREQDFGNFQPCSAEMRRMWQERADYGHFFYRIPNGESAADAYDRISGFNESLWRQFGEDDFASVCVLVTHGLMSRIFLMKWYHFSVEYFEDLRNVDHCEFLIMRRQDDAGKYILDNKLRTWSDLARQQAERKAPKADGEPEGEGILKAIPKGTTAASTNGGYPMLRRRWGGCPNGCNHDKSFKIRNGLADLVKQDRLAPAQSNNHTNGTNETSGPEVRLHRTNTGPLTDNPSFDGNGASRNHNAPQTLTDTRDVLLNVGRDFGGTDTGHNSVAVSDADSSDSSHHEQRDYDRPTTASSHEWLSSPCCGHQSRMAWIEGDERPSSSSDGEAYSAAPRLLLDRDVEAERGFEGSIR